VDACGILNGAIIDEFRDAAFRGKLERLAQLLDAGAEVNSICGAGGTPTALHAAIEGEQLECVRLLVSRGADVEQSADGQTPLAHAVEIAIDGTIQTGGSPGDEPTEIVELLLAHGANPKSGLEVARVYNNRKLLAVLNAGG
jgi:ankyrin repeat protein